MENLEIFRKNGFDFVIEEDGTFSAFFNGNFQEMHTTWCVCVSFCLCNFITRLIYVA